MKNKRQNVELFNELHTNTHIQWRRTKEKKKPLEKRAAFRYYFLVLRSLTNSWHRMRMAHTYVRQTEIEKQILRNEQLHLRIENTNKTQKDMPLPKIIWNVFWLLNQNRKSSIQCTNHQWIVVVVTSHQSSSSSLSVLCGCSCVGNENILSAICWFSGWWAHKCVPTLCSTFYGHHTERRC